MGRGDQQLTFNAEIAARTCWQETRGEPVEGQRAVAHAIVNRLKDGRWGSTLGEVCLSEYHGIYQFSGWSRTDPNRKAAFALADGDPLLLSFSGLIQSALSGESDPTNGATHYYAESIAAPVWVAGDPSRGVLAATFCGKFGNQLFYTGVK